ncbi:ABC transporter permease [Gloeocapsa sp. BRSZ]
MTVSVSKDASIKFDTLVRSLGRKWLFLHAALGFAFIYLPILVLVLYSFNASRFNAVWRGFTFDWYRGLLQIDSQLTANVTDIRIWDALQNSLLVALISTLLATVFGTAIALALERFRFPGRVLIDTLLFLPIVIPEITMGISLLVFFSLVFRLIENLTGIRITFGLPTIIIGHVAFNISFVAITVRARLAELDPALEEAALDLGANEWKTLSRVILPLIAPAIFSGALLAFTLSLDDFVVTFFTAGVGATTLPLFVYGMIKFSVTPAINAISTLMLLASLLLIVPALVIETKELR